jgi:hypothetical protein
MAYKKGDWMICYMIYRLKRSFKELLDWNMFYPSTSFIITRRKGYKYADKMFYHWFKIKTVMKCKIDFDQSDIDVYCKKDNYNPEFMIEVWFDIIDYVRFMRGKI